MVLRHQPARLALPPPRNGHEDVHAAGEGRATADRRERAVDRRRQPARAAAPPGSRLGLPRLRLRPQEVRLPQLVGWPGPPVLPGRREADGRGAETARRADEGQEEGGLLALVLRCGVGPVRAVPHGEPDRHQRRWVPATPLPPLPEAVPRRWVRHGGDLRPGEEPLDRRQAQGAVAQGVRRLRLPRHQAGPHLPERRRRLEGGRTHGLRHRGQHLEPPEAHRDRTGAGQHERSVLRVRRPPRHRCGRPLQGKEARYLHLPLEMATSNRQKFRFLR